MNSFKVLAIVCLVVAKARSSPLPQPQPENDLFAGFLRNAQLGTPSKESDIVKRRIFESNPDGELKQVSLQSLIGDLEDSLFASALSVHKVINDKAAEIPEIRPETEEHKVTRRHLNADDSIIETTTPTVAEGEERKVILQTTEKVPQAGGVPAHIIIDRIAIEPSSGSRVPLIPTFEFKHTRTSDSERKPEITKISISKTEISAVPNTTAPTTTSTSTSTTTTAATTTTGTTESHESTTAKTIEHLKEVEEELKEKVAEIEAEPVILSARV